MQAQRVDFYVLNTNKIEIKLNFVCRLIEKIYLKNHTLFVFCEHQPLAEAIDEWLWVFDAESFVPHNLLGEGLTPPPPVQLGWEAPPKTHRDILFNLDLQVPPFIQQFRRVIEIIHDNQDAKQQGRERYRAYQQLGCTLHTHPIDCQKIGVADETDALHP